VAFNGLARSSEPVARARGSRLIRQAWDVWTVARRSRCGRTPVLFWFKIVRRLSPLCGKYRVGEEMTCDYWLFDADESW